MLGSPAPLTSHWLCGVPGRQFSLSIAFAGEPQFAWALEESAKHSRRAPKVPVTGVPNFISHSLEVRSDQLCTRKARLRPKTSAAVPSIWRKHRFVCRFPRDLPRAFTLMSSDLSSSRLEHVQTVAVR